MPHVRFLTTSLSLTLISSAFAAPPFTATQSTAGQTVYTANCQACHGTKLQGGAGPTLVGKVFQQKWGRKKVDDLYYIISSQMPLNAPGSLTATQYLNVTTFILQRNGIKPGSKALTKADFAKYTVMGK